MYGDGSGTNDAVTSSLTVILGRSLLAGFALALAFVSDCTDLKQET